MARKIVVEGQGTDLSAYCRQLEAGNILFFPQVPFDFPQEEIDFLLQQRQGGSKTRKNIAYKPQLDVITNHTTDDPKAAQMMKSVLRGYSARVTQFLSQCLAPYAPHWKHDYASFRPFQEKGRPLRLRARNDLLHVDAFPTRPLHGDRILRFFTNINPTESRNWITSQPFESLIEQFGGTNGVPFPRSVSHSILSHWIRKGKELLRSKGLKIPMRSPYDRFMLHMHNYLKENGEFQKNCPKDAWEFPPNSCWAVFTDQVSHAALSGQYAIEQTFLIPQRALINSEKSPLAVLERLSQRNMVR